MSFRPLYLLPSTPSPLGQMCSNADTRRHMSGCNQMVNSHTINSKLYPIPKSNPWLIHPDSTSCPVCSPPQNQLGPGTGRRRKEERARRVELSTSYIASVYSTCTIASSQVPTGYHPEVGSLAYSGNSPLLHRH
jgi:hypothetical protein